jgi:hypothetical protein
MPADPNRRIEAWKAKYNTQRVKETLDDRKEQMIVQVHAAFADLCAMEEKTREVLNLSNVATILYVPYLDFARQLFKLSRKRNIAGASLAREAKVLVDKWHGRGLDRAILKTICVGVFSVTVPED